MSFFISTANFFYNFLFKIEINIVFIWDLLIKIAVELEKDRAITHVFYIIISKFKDLHNFWLVILFIVDKSLKENPNYIILLFNLVVYLGIKGDKKFLLNS